MKKILILFLYLVTLTSCKFYYSSPLIGYGNCSYDLIEIADYNKWNKNFLKPDGIVPPGGGSGQIFWLKRKKDLYGPVEIKWKNAKGELKTYNFNFEKNPNFPESDLKIITITFLQDIAEYHTNLEPDYKENLKLTPCKNIRKKYNIEKPKDYDWRNFKYNKLPKHL